MSEKPSIFSEWLDDFVRRGRVKTHNTYSALLKPFEAWLIEQGKLNNFDEKAVITYADSQNWRGSSKNVFLYAIRSWAKFKACRIVPGEGSDGLRKTILDQARFTRLSSVKGWAYSPPPKKALSLAQIRELFDTVNAEAATVSWIFLWLGIRAGELKSLKISDPATGRLEVLNEKIPGSRVLFADDYTTKIISSGILEGYTKRPYSQLWRMFKKYDAWFPDIKITPHLFRHTFATSFIEAGVSPSIVRAMLGHGARSTLDGYVHVSESSIRDVMVNRHWMKQLEPTNTKREPKSE